MLPRWMNELFANLDRALLAACDHEERRAALLAGDGAGGWDGVRNLARPSMAQLAYADDEPEPLFGKTPPAFANLQAAFGLNHVELEVLLVVLAPHVESCYRTLFGVLQDAIAEPWVTERLLVTVLGRSPGRRHALLKTLAPWGRLRETGLITVTSGQAPMSSRTTTKKAAAMRSAMWPNAWRGRLSI